MNKSSVTCIQDERVVDKIFEVLSVVNVWCGLQVAVMYGLICENVSSFIKYKYGDDTWDNIRRLANIDSPTFSVHKVS